MIDLGKLRKLFENLIDESRKPKVVRQLAAAGLVEVIRAQHAHNQQEEEES